MAPTHTILRPGMWVKTCLALVAAASFALPPSLVRAAEPGAVGAAATDPSAVEIVAKGKAAYARHCSHCHGFDMVNPGTISFDLRRFPHDDKARFVHSVTEGKNGRMPSWGDLLSREEIDQIWAYVMTGGAQ
jgi:mono/diheme cytochrome c family protein